MKYRLMDILACPMCRSFPLKLSVFEHRDIHRPDKVRKCELYCGFHRGFVKDLAETECVRCYGFEVGSGLLECSSCGRWYPIVDDIPRMLPDDLRDRKLERKFVEKWQGRLPERVVAEVSQTRQP
ncbi:MAG: Trm112 family protein [Candidatus Caldarchaeum sp.]|nr:Trm112 family protein [Candidatus Caldarchaeum sp.]MDW8360118.1 Trm112 family protein [Candidatus Caldarchaeum sp.]